MKKKNLIYAILSFAVVLAVYCIVFLVIPFAKAASSWITFGFTVLAICLSGGVFAYAFCVKSPKSKLYGFPIFKVALIYAAVQFVGGVAICIVAAFVNVPVWIPIVLFVIFLAAGALGFIATDSAKDIVEQIDATTSSTQTIARLRAEIDGIIDVCTDADVRNDLKLLEEQFRCSDPTSCLETKDAEDELASETQQLRDKVQNKDFVQAAALAEEIKIKLAERNRLCKLYKK